MNSWYILEYKGWVGSIGEGAELRLSFKLSATSLTEAIRFAQDTLKKTVVKGWQSALELRVASKVADEGGLL